MRYASEMEPIDFIYYTGDLPPHNVWNQSRDEQLFSLQTINDLLAKTFPTKTFYPAVGNHEAGKRCDRVQLASPIIRFQLLVIFSPRPTRDRIIFPGCTKRWPTIGFGWVCLRKHAKRSNVEDYALLSFDQVCASFP